MLVFTSCIIIFLRRLQGFWDINLIGLTLYAYSRIASLPTCSIFAGSNFARRTPKCKCQVLFVSFSFLRHLSSPIVFFFPSISALYRSSTSSLFSYFFLFVGFLQLGTFVCMKFVFLFISSIFIFLSCFLSLCISTFSTSHFITLSLLYFLIFVAFL